MIKPIDGQLIDPVSLKKHLMVTPSLPEAFRSAAGEHMPAKLLESSKLSRGS
jgi:hypothetical protein